MVKVSVFKQLGQSIVTALEESPQTPLEKKKKRL